MILIISPESWGAHTVSKQHYAITLGKAGCRVLFLNPPTKGLDGIQVEATAEHSDVFEVNTPPVAKGLRFYPARFRRWIEQRWLERLEREIGGIVKVVWLFENSRFFDMKFAGERLKIYHQVDLNQDFQVERAALTADICFSTTDFISQKLQAFNKHTYKVHHGVFVANNSRTLPDNLVNNFSSGKMHAGYIGNLDIPYVDVSLLSELVKSFPEVIFHFVGSYSQTGELYRACSNAGNVIWWGRVESTLIPAILTQCDILLITYLAENFREQLASPHKMMEYLASGKIVVATYTDEYKDKRQLLEMVDDSRDYLKTFSRVVENLGEYNSLEKQEVRIEYAQQHSYDRQLDKIFALLKKHDLDKKLLEGRA